MAKKYGKNINFLKKQTPQPSTQVSGVPLQSLIGLSNLSKAVTLKGKGVQKGTPTMPRGGNWFEGSSSTNGAFLTKRDYFDNQKSSPFYNYLIENCIARTKTPIYDGTLASLNIIPTGVDNLLKKGDTFYIFNTNTFRSTQLTADDDLTSTATLVRFSSTVFTKADYYPSGSYIIADNKKQIKKVSEGLVYKKFTLTNAEYTALNTTPYTLLTGLTNYIHMPVSCYIQLIHGADEMTTADLYIGHTSGSTTVKDYWASLDRAFYRERNNVLIQLGASTYGAGSSTGYQSIPTKSKDDDARGDSLYLYSTSDFTSASNIIVLHLWYQTIYTS